MQPFRLAIPIYAHAVPIVESLKPDTEDESQRVKLHRLSLQEVDKMPNTWQGLQGPHKGVSAKAARQALEFVLLQLLTANGLSTEERDTELKRLRAL
eukprot:7299905-Pyramimonas_sp.AAC.1